MPELFDNTHRALKKYEAELLAVQTTAVAYPLQDGTQQSTTQTLYSPFGPLIAKSTIPQHLLESLNHYIDQTLATKTHSVQGAEFMAPDAIVSTGDKASLGFYLAQQILAYATAVEGRPATGVEFDALWAVSQFEGAPSPVHFHSTDISGVFYLRVPQLDEVRAGEQDKNYIGGRQAGYLNFLSGGKQAFSKSLLSVKPVVGELYIFPGWLLHGVEAFAGSGERRSIAFNANVSW